MADNTKPYSPAVTGHMTLRKLRLWHWYKVVSNRSRANMFDRDAETWEGTHPGKRCRSSRNRTSAAHGMADWHLGAVQALNEFFDTVAGDTAERDAELSKRSSYEPR